MRPAVRPHAAFVALLTGVVAALCVFESAALAQQAQVSAAPAQDASLGSESPLDAATSAAVEHFRAGRFAEALAAFDRALALTPPATERATLEFNGAVCLYELGRYDEAEQRFARVSQFDPTAAPLALLNAGLAALRAGRLADAERHLRSAPRGDAEAEQRRRELADQLAAARQAAAAAERDSLVERAAQALRQGRFREALMVLQFLLARSPGAPAEQLADLHYGIGTAYFELGDFARARHSFEAAAELVPDDGELRYWVARSALAYGDTEAGLAGLQQALALGLDADEAREAREILQSHDPRPSPGCAGLLAFGAGYDSNPSQSGIADATGLSEGRQSRGSAFLSAAVQLHGTWPMGRSWAGRAYYALDWLGMLRRAVQDLSLQAHEGGLRLYWAPSRRLGLRLTGAGTLYYAGLRRPEPFAWDLIGAARADFASAETMFTRFELEVRRVQGLDDRDYLSGLRTTLHLAERFAADPVEVWLGARLRHNDIGVRQFPITAETFPQCGARCDGADYLVPLGYLAPSAYAELDVDVSERLTLGLSANIESRRYLAQSYIAISPGVQENPKTRQDLRLRGAARGELALDEQANALLVADYDALSSRSNVALDPDDPEHALDCDDRDFVQHVAQIGVELHF
jgi:tetratricopeptide (TPR) repeat protein